MNLNEIIEHKIDLKIIKKAMIYMDLREITLDGGNEVLLDLS
jgi:hypothetical protein